mmetsp:Transcript_19619/g.58348  ORF Transcript_19619/g.58348 Transcript_19619/m.58348 type:complete len:291 (+) Transcript_19619:249-1121(+)
MVEWLSQRLQGGLAPAARGLLLHARGRDRVRQRRGPRHGGSPGGRPDGLLRVHDRQSLRARHENRHHRRAAHRARRGHHRRRRLGGPRTLHGRRRDQGGGPGGRAVGRRPLHGLPAGGQGLRRGAAGLRRHDPQAREQGLPRDGAPAPRRRGQGAVREPRGGHGDPGARAGPADRGSRPRHDRRRARRRGRRRGLERCHPQDGGAAHLPRVLPLRRGRRRRRGPAGRGRQLPGLGRRRRRGAGRLRGPGRPRGVGRRRARRPRPRGCRLGGRAPLKLEGTRVEEASSRSP